MRGPSPQQSVSRLDQNDTDRECRRCGSHVTRHFERVCGDNSDTVYRCPSCVGLYDSDKDHWGDDDDGA